MDTRQGQGHVALTNGNAAAALKSEQTISPSKHNVLGSALFPSLETAAAGSSGSVEQMQSEDPLASQIWKFFSKTKQQLPNQQRMENLTWRMMALNLRKRQQQQQKMHNRYLYNFLFLLDRPSHVSPSSFDWSAVFLQQG
jgi:GATA-binding protein